MVTRQLQVERTTEKVRRPKTEVLPLSHATNQHFQHTFSPSSLGGGTSRTPATLFGRNRQVVAPSGGEVCIMFLICYYDRLVILMYCPVSRSDCRSRARSRSASVRRKSRAAGTSAWRNPSTWSNRVSSIHSGT